MAEVGTMAYYRNMDVASLKREKAREFADLKEARNHLGKPGDEGYKERQQHISMLIGRTVCMTQVISEKTHRIHAHK